MGWFSAFKTAVGTRRYLIGAVFTAVVTFFDWAKPKLVELGIRDLIGVPSWVLGIIVGLLLLLYWFWDTVVALEKRMKGARINLSTLRRDGVVLRNEGQHITAHTWPRWEHDVLKWKDDVISNIEQIDKGCAEWFSVLDVVPLQPRVDYLPLHNPHEKLFREHDLRIKNLGELIQKLWEK